MEEAEIARLIFLADERLRNYDPAAVSSIEEVMDKFGITYDELSQMDEAEIEFCKEEEVFYPKGE
ncbi:MAG: hypothetical protein NC078_00520 [Ruminococcus sp.]|nr:hypothetical protein [Ruminococcus sp.]